MLTLSDSAAVDCSASPAEDSLGAAGGLRDLTVHDEDCVAADAVVDCIVADAVSQLSAAAPVEDCTDEAAVDAAAAAALAGTTVQRMTHCRHLPFA